MIARCKERLGSLRRLRSVFGLAMLLGAADPVVAGSLDGYRISVGDVVSFQFLDKTDPAEQLTVAANGQITVPYLGDVDVAAMTVPEAKGAIRKSLVERKLFLDPQFAMSVVGFRPIFVLGDVRSPGSFPFQPMMNLEQAVALAGGQSAGQSTAEDRIVAQARLRGEIDEGAVKITGEAAAAARLNAQLGGRRTVVEADLPEKARDFVSPAVVSSLLPTEQRILETDDRAFETRRDQLDAAIREVTGALANLGQLAERQKQTIASAEDDVERMRVLYKRGIKTLTDISGLERDAGIQESHLLEIYNQMSTTRRELGELQREMADATDSRLRKTLSDLQTHTAEIERLIAERRSNEQQILLLSTLVAEETQKTATIAFNYLVRRTVANKVETRDAALGDTIQPGDTVLVSIDRSAGAELTTTRTAAELLR